MKRIIFSWILCTSLVLGSLMQVEAGPLCFYEKIDGKIQIAGHEGEQIIVNLPAFRLYFTPKQALEKEYAVAIGKPSTPTPVISWNNIIEREVNPAYYSTTDDTVIAGGTSYNPLGYRWMRVYKNVGIHGNSAAWSIGKSVSGGCMRMNNEDVESLYAQTNYLSNGETIYSPVEVWKRASGVYLKIYPDVYSWGYDYQTEINTVFSSLWKEGRLLLVSPLEVPTNPDEPVVIKIAE